MLNKDLIGRKRALSLEETETTLSTKRFRATEKDDPRDTKENKRLVSPVIIRCQFIWLFHASHPICSDCGQCIKSRPSHQALCGRKTVKCSYQSLTSGGEIPIMLHRVNRMFTCWRCDKVLKKDSSMKVRILDCELQAKVYLPFSRNTQGNA